MAEKAYPAGIDFVAAFQVIDGDGCVVQDFRQQGAAGDKAGGKFKVRRFEGASAPVSFLETDGVRSECDVAALG